MMNLQKHYSRGEKKQQQRIHRITTSKKKKRATLHTPQTLKKQKEQLCVNKFKNLEEVTGQICFKTQLLKY